MKIDFKCPYNEFSCVHMNTCGMSVDKACSECEHYHNGVRATGALPDPRPLIKLTGVTVKRIIKFCGITLKLPIPVFKRFTNWKSNKNNNK